MRGNFRARSGTAKNIRCPIIAVHRSEDSVTLILMSATSQVGKSNFEHTFLGITDEFGITVGVGI